MQIQEPSLAPPVSIAEPPPGHSWRASLLCWWSATRAILPIFLLTRFLLLLLTYLGGVLFKVPNYASSPLLFRDVLYSWAQWDANRFITIALQGYTSLDYATYFPLFPTLEHFFYHLLHRNIMEIGLLVSNLTFFATLIVFYRFVETEFDRELAARSVLYLAIFPTALFFFAPYSDALLLLLILACFYSLRRGYWWLAGLCGFLAMLTHLTALLLAVIFVCEFVRQVGPLLRASIRDKQYMRTLLLCSGLPAVMLIPLGLVLYSYGLSFHFHDPLAFLHAQSYWLQGVSAPWVAPFRAIKGLLSYSPLIFATPHILIDLSALVLFLVLLMLSFVGPERLAPHQWTFALFGLLVLLQVLIFPSSPGANGIPYDPLPSMQRYVLEIFVGFIMLARFGRRAWFHQTYLLLSLPLFAFLVLQFLTGHWTV